MNGEDQIRTAGSRNSGFTLLEVMVAVAMLAIFLIPLLITHGNTVRNLRYARELTRSTILAQSRMGMLETLGFDELEAEVPDDVLENYSYLDMVEEVSFSEEMIMAHAMVKIFPRSVKPGKNEDASKRIGVDLETYIVSLYFEEEEEEIEEE